MDATKLITTKKMFLFFVCCSLLIAFHECTENIPRSSSLKEEKMAKNAVSGDVDCYEMKCIDQEPCWCCIRPSTGSQQCLPTAASCKTVCNTI
ncbi:hypothetical protein MKW94_026910 [Papaver nudicaule]|uniref:Uncharacterized protein n=1 Tax=Papaver nudicaule TaxID=74823 RepID=A0AA41VRN0_PAPNU|nr:hypothetical protein [Papaver nudicaule]